jgi:hypothetical protein
MVERSRGTTWQNAPWAFGSRWVGVAALLGGVLWWWRSRHRRIRVGGVSDAWLMQHERESSKEQNF